MGVRVKDQGLYGMRRVREIKCVSVGVSVWISEERTI